MSTCQHARRVTTSEDGQLRSVCMSCGRDVPVEEVAEVPLEGVSVASRLRPLLLGLAIPAIALIAIYVANLTTQWSFVDLAEDPPSNPLYGSGSDLMLLGWAATIGVCALSWVITRDRFFIVIGALTFGLWVDDALMIHDYWFAVWGAINEKLMFVAWGVAAWAVALKYRHRFLCTAPLVMITSILLLAGSLFFDREVFRDMHWAIASLEDVCKMLGIFAWLTWVVLIGLDITRLQQHVALTPAVD